MKSKSLFWGLFFILLAIFVIAMQTGSFEKIGVLSVLAGFLLLMLSVYSAIDRNYIGAFVPLAFIYKIFEKPIYAMNDMPLPDPDISIWMLIIAAVFTGIGFHIIFRKFPKRMPRFNGHRGVNCCDNGPINNVVESIDENNPQVKVTFGSSSKYLHSDCLRGGQFSVSFGELKVFFDQAVPDPAGAEIFIDCSFGAAQLYVPRTWQVINNIHASLGAVEVKSNRAEAVEGAPRLILSGNVNFGGVEIHYV